MTGALASGPLARGGLLLLLKAAGSRTVKALGARGLVG
jgi:hypothetical protein